jgi:hypothetical protein
MEKDMNRSGEQSRLPGVRRIDLRNGLMQKQFGGHLSRISIANSHVESGEKVDSHSLNNQPRNEAL